MYMGSNENNVSYILLPSFRVHIAKFFSSTFVIAAPKLNKVNFRIAAGVFIWRPFSSFRVRIQLKVVNMCSLNWNLLYIDSVELRTLFVQLSGTN